MRVHTAALYAAAYLHTAYAQLCRPTMNNDLGPMYTGYAPEKNNGQICAANEWKKDLYTASAFYLPRSVTTGNHELIVRGQIQDEDCKPISGVEVEVWQAGPNGRYGNTSMTHPDGTCRGLVRTNGQGQFEFHTQLPGSFGLTSGTLYGGYMDIPYWWPRSLQVLLYKKGYEVATTKLFFQDDPYVGSNNIDYGVDEETGEKIRLPDHKALNPTRAGADLPYTAEGITLVLGRRTHQDIPECDTRTECVFEKYCGEFDAMAFCMISDWALDTAATGEKYGMDPLTMIFAGVFYFAVPVILTLNFMGVYYGGDMKPGNVGVNTRTDIRQKKMN